MSYFNKDFEIFKEYGSIYSYFLMELEINRELNNFEWDFFVLYNNNLTKISEQYFLIYNEPFNYYNKMTNNTFTKDCLTNLEVIVSKICRQ